MMRRSSGDTEIQQTKSSMPTIAIVRDALSGVVRWRAKGLGGTMAAKKKAAPKKKGAKKATGDLIISKSRVKAATKKCNVGGDFYGALDAAVRKIIAGAEERAQGNKRKTLKPVDI